MGEDLVLRSCSRCDSRWWLRGEQPAALDEVLGVVGAAGTARRAMQAV
jgi:hypothetical protein